MSVSESCEPMRSDEASEKAAREFQLGFQALWGCSMYAGTHEAFYWVIAVLMAISLAMWSSIPRSNAIVGLTIALTALTFKVLEPYHLLGPNMLARSIVSLLEIFVFVVGVSRFGVAWKGSVVVLAVCILGTFVHFGVD